MADIPSGDSKGNKQRQEELKAIRDNAVKSREAINFLNESIKVTQKQIADLGGKNFMAGANTSVDGLTKRLSQVTVETLKSGRARTQVAKDIAASQAQEAQNEASINNLKQERLDITNKVASLEKQAQAERQAASDAFKAATQASKQDAIAAADAAKQAEIELNQAKLDGNEAIIAVKQREYDQSVIASQQAQVNAEKIERTAQAQLDKAEAAAQLTDQEIADLNKLGALYGVQIEQLQERNAELRKGVEVATSVQQEMERVNKGMGSSFAAIQKLVDKTAGQIPIVGEAITLVFGELAEAQKMYSEAIAEGDNAFKKFAAVGKAGLGMLKNLALAALAAFVKLAKDGFMKTSEVAVKLNKSVAGSTLDMSAQFSRVSSAAAQLKVPLAEAAETIASLNEGLGMSLDFTAGTTREAVKLVNKFGVSGESVAHLVKLSASLGKNFEEVSDAIALGTAKFNAQNNVSISTKAIYDDIGSASATTLRNIGKSPAAIVRAAAAARSLGMSMDEINDAAKSTLDFENSIAQEMEAELMLGKDLNLDRLRAAAATGDTATQAAELKRLVDENKDAIGNNVLAQEQFANTLGISVDQYNDMIKTQDAQAVLTGKSGAAQAANDKNRKKSNEEIMASIDTTVGKLTSLASKIEKFQENMTLGASGFAQGIIDGFKNEGFLGGIRNAGSMIWNELTKAWEQGFDYFKSGSNVGKFLGAMGLMGGAAIITVKGFDMLKNILGLGRGSRFNPMYVKMKDGTMSDISDIVGRKGRAGFLKQIKTLFKKPDVMFRALKMKGGTFGKLLGRLGSSSARISKTFSSIGNVGTKVAGTFSKLGPSVSKASGLLGKGLKGILGKVAAPLELAIGGFTAVSQVSGKTAEELKAMNIKENISTAEAGVLGVLTGDASRGSSLSSMVGIEKGSAADDAMGIAGSTARGALTGAAIGSVIPVVGTAVGAAVGGAVGLISEGWKVFSDPNSKLRQGVVEFGGKVKEMASSAWESIKSGASSVWESTKGVAGKIGGFLSDRFAQAREGAGIVINTIRDKAKAIGGAIGDKVGEIRNNVANFIEANGGFVGAVGAAASGLASRAKDALGSAWKGIKDWWNGEGDKAKAASDVAAKEIAQPMVKMTAAQTASMTKAINDANNASAKATNTAIGDMKVALMQGSIDSTNMTLAKLEENQSKAEKRHSSELTELRNQTALLFEYIAKPQKSIIKMDSYVVGKAVVNV